MENNIKWKIVEIGPKKVRIELEQFSKVPSIEEYQNYIKNLLGLNKQKNRNLMDDGYSVDLADNLLLYKELKQLDNATYQEVVFSSPNGDITVDAENFEQVFKKLEEKRKEDETKNKNHKNIEAIEHSIGELFERG